MRLWVTVFILAISPCVAFAYDRDTEGDSLWISPGAEAALYGYNPEYRVSGSVGGGLAVAYGGRVSLGLKAAYFVDLAGMADFLELGVLLRFFFLNAQSGPFVQLSGGPAFSFPLVGEKRRIPNSPSEISAGVSLGWRFLLGKTVFIEPSIRGGYPYVAGAGICTGLRF